MPQIELKRVTKEYDGFKALDNISLAIEDNEFIFIIGPSGAGKSTFVKLLIREVLPSSGEIFFNDKNILNIPSTGLSSLRRKIGVVFQDFKLLDSRTVFENVAIALEVVDADKHEIQNVIPNVLSMVGLSEKASSYPYQLSGGETQRVSIARALAHEPDVLVLDEPTGMIDPDSAEEIIKILEKINSLGTTVIMTTHNEHIVDKLKKRVIKFDKGKVTSDKMGGKYRA